MSENTNLDFYVSCPPGLEPYLAVEYHQLGFNRKKIKPTDTQHADFGSDGNTGGMEFEGSLDHVYLANLHMRVASRVSIRLGDFIAITFAELRKKASKLEWSNYLKPGQKVIIQATCHKSRLYHSAAVAERVLGAIQDHFGLSGKTIELADPDSKSQLVLVRFVNDHCTISMDSSGELLHKRGYRQAVAKAPLRENIAAGLIMASGWDLTSSIIDPFCGSGTIPIEAALLARNIAPGINRSFQFMNWATFNKQKWEMLLSEAKNQIKPSCPEIFGFDRDTGAIEMSRSNAARAGQKETIKFSHQAISHLEPPAESGWMITNPPYGVRVSEDKDLRNLYARFGSVLKQKFPSWKLGILSSEDRLIASLGLASPEKTIRLVNGGIPVSFSVFTS